MIDGKYILTIRTPYGLKRGVVTLNTQGNSVKGELHAFGKKHIIQNATIHHDLFAFSGELNSHHFSTVFKATCKIKNGTLTAIADTPNGQMSIIGQQHNN